MNDELRQALRDLLQDGYEEGSEGVVLFPATERELLGCLRLLRERGGRVHHGVSISRRRFDTIGRVEEKSAVLQVGAGALLSDVEAVARRAGLTLGRLSPGALLLDVAGFVEGPYQGLRGVPFGRLEPVPMGLTVVMPQGLVYVSHPSPRRAAGPELSALFLGGGGRAGLVRSAVLRLCPRPATRRRTAFRFVQPRALTGTLVRALSDGCQLEQAWVERRGARMRLEVSMAGSEEGVERDHASLALRAAAAGGRPEGPEGEAAPAGRKQDGPPREKEASWSEVERSLVVGNRLVLYRLAVDSVVVEGEVEGLALAALPVAGAPLPLWADIISAVDAEGLLGGAA